MLKKINDGYSFFVSNEEYRLILDGKVVKVVVMKEKEQESWKLKTFLNLAERL